MKNHNSDFEGVMKSVLGEQNEGSRLVSESSGNRPAFTPRSSRDRIANLGILFGISLMTSVAIVTQWTPAGVEPSRLWLHAVVAIALAQLAIISGFSFKAVGRTSVSKSTPRRARFAKTERRIEPRLIEPRPQAISIPEKDRSQVSTGLLSGKTYGLFSDGSCEIDTMFGRRRFEDVDAAREFVGG